MSEGTKYHPLFEHLLFSGRGHSVMTFNEIEEILGKPLPPSARQREEWWSNSPSGHSQARAWMRASYKTSKVDLAGEKVEFKLEGWPAGYERVNVPLADGTNGQSGFGEKGQSKYAPPSRPPAILNTGARAPMFGCMKGFGKLQEGYDLTQPSDPDWADMLDA